LPKRRSRLIEAREKEKEEESKKQGNNEKKFCSLLIVALKTK
jgi:hypothetical protein